jgi:hypothetical protein
MQGKLYLYESEQSEKVASVQTIWTDRRVVRVPQELIGGADCVLALCPQSFDLSRLAEDTSCLVLRIDDGEQVRERRAERVWPVGDSAERVLPVRLGMWVFVCSEGIMLRGPCLLQTSSQPDACKEWMEPSQNMQIASPSMLSQNLTYKQYQLPTDIHARVAGRRLVPQAAGFAACNA